jgi:hypothetical protein
MKTRACKFIVKNISRILLFLVSVNATGQNSNIEFLRSSGETGISDTTSLIANQIAYLKNIYSEKVEVPDELINGKEYEPYFLRSENKPLLFSSRERTAAIITRTRRYNNFTLQYDTFLDEVIYTDTSRILNFRFPQIALNKDIVDGFSLFFNEDSLKFRNFRLPECSEKNLKEGFYEVVYEGKSSYIIRHESTFYEKQGLNNYKYSPKNFIGTGNGFFKIKSLKSFLIHFGVYAGRMKEYINSSGIRVKRAGKNEILSIIRFYDSLPESE